MRKNVAGVAPMNAVATVGLSVMTKHPEWDKWEWLTTELPYSEIPGPDAAKHVYGVVLKHLLDNVIDPKSSARGIIFALETKLKGVSS